MAMPEAKKKVYDYGDIFISLENCILPDDKLDETPSMKDGLDRDTENELRMAACEMIQSAGILLKIPQTAMATGQVILQRFYFSKTMVKYDIEVSAMAAIFLAAKIEENPRRLRDVINVCQHIKQRMMQTAHTPMDYFSQKYFDLKNEVIKAERRMLKELGFCVHVKHPHKLIILYLQMIEHEKNQPLARKAWNYMNDSLRSDVFVKFSPETIACACIFLAARSLKILLPNRPPWYELFDATYDDIEDIALSILRLYSKPRRKLSHLEAVVNKLKKEKIEKEKAANALKLAEKKAGSFTPSQNEDSNLSAPNPAVLALNNNISKSNSKPSSRTNSPVEKPDAKSSTKNGSSETKRNKRSRHHSDSDETSDSSSDSGSELPSKKYAQQKKQYDKTKKRRSPSSDSENDRRVSSKPRRSISPDERRSKSYKDNKLKDTNGHYDKNYSRSKKRSRSRSRSPVKRRSPASPSSKKEKYYRDREREREKTRSKDKYRSRR